MQIGLNSYLENLFLKHFSMKYLTLFFKPFTSTFLEFNLGLMK